MRNYRVSVTVHSNRDVKVFGLVTRHHKEHGCYLFSVDWQASKIRLERWMGNDHMVVRQIEAPWLSSKHTLAMQVDGFRLECLVDDEVVLNLFDGAIRDGSPGSCLGG